MKNLLNTIRQKIKDIQVRSNGALRTLSSGFNSTINKVITGSHFGRGLIVIVGIGVVFLGVILIPGVRSKVFPNSQIGEDAAVNGVYGTVNPTFSVDFGDKDNSDIQKVRFETIAGNNNPFSEEVEEMSFWDKAREFFVGKENIGLTFSLIESSVNGDLSEQSKLLHYDLESTVNTDISTTTELEGLGRTFSDYFNEISEDDEVTKDTIINRNVVDGVDIEYQIIDGIGLKEEILLRWRDEYSSGCEDNCSVPPNTFTFELTLDDGVELHRSMTTVNDNPGGTYYFTDDKGYYLAHFLPAFAQDETGAKTNNIDFDVESSSDKQTFEITVSLDLDWLLSIERVYPIRIDPSIVHDTEGEFDLGESLNRTESISSPKVQLVEQELPADIHTVGLWHMNEDSGASVADSSGNGNTGTATGTTVVTGMFDDARSFNGSSDFIEVNNNSVFDFTSGDQTLEVWFKSDDQIDSSLATRVNVLNKRGSEAGNPGWYLAFIEGSGKLSFGRDNATAFDSIDSTKVSWAADTWFYIVITFNDDTNTGIFYVDSIIDTIDGTVTVNPTVTTQALRFGTNRNGIELFDGIIDEVRISNIARTPEEIKANSQKRPYGTYISDTLDLTSGISSIDDLQWTENGVSTGDGETPYSTTGLVGQWDFNETSGTTADNEGSCGASCDGTLTNMTTTGQDDAAGDGWTSDNRKWGVGALMFDGTDGFVNISDDDPFMLQTFSIESWFWIADTSDQKSIFGCTGTSGYKGYRWKVKDGSLSYITSDGVGAEVDKVTDPNPAIAGKWYYSVITVEQSTAIKMYIDGELVDTDSSTSDVLYDATHYPQIGRQSSFHTNLLQGVIDSTRFYSRVLSADEILSNYNKTNIEFMTRTSADELTWEGWKPTTGETQVNSMDYAYIDGPDSSAILSYWPIDETADNSCSGGEDVCDRVGCSHGTDTGSSTVQDGYFENSRDFNGSSQYISLLNTASSQLGSKNAISVSSWVQRDTTGGIDTILDLTITGTSSKVLLEYQADNTIKCGGRSDSGDSLQYEATTGTVTDSDWHHIVCVIDIQNDNVIIYKDGIDQATSGSASWTQTSFDADVGTAHTIGTDAEIANYYDGNIDELAIYGDVLTSSEVYSLYSTGSDYLEMLTHSYDQIFSYEGEGSQKLEIGIPQVDNDTVGLWHLDETNGDNAGDDVFDETSNNNDGEFYGTNIATSVVQGVQGKARDFNGSDDYIDIGDVDDIDTATTLSSCAWVYHDTITTDDSIIAKNNGTTDGFIFYRDDSGSVSGRTDTYTIYFADSGDTDTIRIEGATNTSKLNNWTHVCFTYDQGSSVGLRLYIDGEEDANGPVSTTAIGAINVSANTLVIGNDHGTRPFDGRIDEVIINESIFSADDIYEMYRAGRDHRVSTSISSTDISSSSKLPFWIAADRPGTYLEATIGESLYGNGLPDSDTVGYWRLEEENGTVAYIKDYSSYGHDGTPTGTSILQGKIGKARDFTGTGSYLTIAHNTDYNITSAITLEAWINPDTIESAGSWDRIIEKGTNNQYSLSVTTATSYGLIARFYGTSTVTYYSYYIPPTGQWTHVAATYDGSDVLFYANGVLVKTVSGTGSVTTTTDDLVIGDWTTHTRGFDGKIDEVRISKIARTANEIRQSYEIGLRTHPVTIDFAASLDSGGTGGLIASSADKLFTTDATDYGLSQQGSGLYYGDTVIVRENYSGTTYIAQGEVKSITASSGEGEVYSWDGDSTFPSGGFTADATVFKWQREYFDITESLDSHLNVITNLTIRVTDGNEGRNVWLDDFKYSTYLTDGTVSSNVTSTTQQYLQYMAIFSTRDTNLTPYLSDVTLNYETGTSLDQLMRHGTYFSDQTKQDF